MSTTTVLAIRTNMAYDGEGNKEKDGSDARALPKETGRKHPEGR
jgi:hypothetical protein